MAPDERSGETLVAPNKEKRKACWAARDKYFFCLDIAEGVHATETAGSTPGAAAAPVRSLT